MPPPIHLGSAKPEEPGNDNQTPQSEPTPGAGSPPDAPKPKHGRSWSHTVARANNITSVLAMLAAVLIVGGVIGYFVAFYKPTSTPKTPKIQNLTSQDIQKLTDLSSSLGNSSQVLNIGADSLFRGKVDVGGDLSVGGHFNANGPVTLSQLNITGNTAVTGLNVGSNLTVTGVTTLQKGATIDQLLAVNGPLNVSGTASISTLNAGTISVQNISISGPLSIGHLTTKGSTPGISGGAIGGGGTVSISGNDTAGTININTGSGPGAGTLASISFRAGFGNAPHVVLTALTPAAAALSVYVTRTANGFTVNAAGTPAAGSVYAFDYIVVN